MSLIDRLQVDPKDFKVKEEPIGEIFIPETVLRTTTEDSVELASCRLCPRGARLQNLLADHFHQHHPETLNESFTQFCNCEESVVLQIQLINHLLSHVVGVDGINIEQNLESVIKVEPEIFRNDSESSTEITVDGASRKFSCNFCPKQSKSGSNVRKHLLHVNEDEGKEEGRRQIRRRYKRPAIANDFTLDALTQKFFCNHCQKQYSSKGKVRQHLHEKHHENKAESKNLKTLQKLTAKNAVDVHQCPECAKIYESAKQFYHHMLTHREKLLCCDKCGRKFNFKQSLSKHLLTHVKVKGDESSQKLVKKIMCELCSFMLNPGKMKQHILNRHSSFRPFKCDEPGCQSSFKEARTLREHKNLHTGEKPFPCEFCDARFHHSATLRIHRLRHTNPDKFKCGICGECFVNNQSLIKHTTRQHSLDNSSSEARPFACNFEGCSSTFRFREFMISHHRNVHNRKKVEMKCDLCNFASDRRKNFNQHMRRAHDIRKRGRISNRVFPTSAS